MTTHIPPFWLSLGGKISIHCTGSWALLIVTVCLCAGVISGYWVIASDWHKREKQCTSERGKSALHDLRVIFIWCATAGYLSRIVLSIYPLWSIYLGALIWLNWITWRYCRKLSKLDIVYSDAEKLQEIHEKLEYSQITDPLRQLEAIKSDLSRYLKRD